MSRDFDIFIHRFIPRAWHSAWYKVGVRELFIVQMNEWDLVNL